MLRIRLQRRGKKGLATYRVVVAERRASVSGKFLADLGFYNPHENSLKVDKESVLTWLKRGAKPSNTLHNLLVNNGMIKGEKVRSWRPKKNKGEEKQEETAEKAQEVKVETKEETKKEEAKEEPSSEEEKK